MNDRFIEPHEALLYERELLTIVAPCGKAVYIPKTWDAKVKIGNGVDYAKA